MNYRPWTMDLNLPPAVLVFDLPQDLVNPVTFYFEHRAQHHTQFTRRETFVMHPLQIAYGHIAYQGIFILAEGHAGVYNIN